jgi:hypothetical protein
METKISYDEAVFSTKRPWRQWAHGEWITIPGLGRPESEKAYSKFMRSMHSWAWRNGFKGSMTRVADGGPDARFRLRWERTHAADFYLLKSTGALAWLGREAQPTVPLDRYEKATAFSRTTAIELCARATAGPWTEYARVLPGENGSSIALRGVLPPLIPVRAGLLPMQVTEREVTAAAEWAERTLLESLAAGEVVTSPAEKVSGDGGDPVMAAIVATVARGRFEQEPVHPVGWEDWELKV